MFPNTANFDLIFTICLVLFFTENALATIGDVKCSIGLHYSQEFTKALETCSEEIKNENKGNQEDKPNGNGNEEPFPYNATVEEFDYDNGCYTFCVYKKAGILNKEDKLPDKKGTPNLFAKGKISNERYAKITSIWDSCLDRTEKIAMKKGMDNCRRILLHEFCFDKELGNAEASLDVDC